MNISIVKTDYTQSVSYVTLFAVTQFFWRLFIIASLIQIWHVQNFGLISAEARILAQNMHVYFKNGRKLIVAEVKMLAAAL